MAKIDDSVKKKVPELRFKGFTDDWEERKLGDTETHFTDGNYGESYPSAKDMSDKANGIPFLRGSDFSNGYLDSSNANYIKPEKHAELTSGHIKQDDIVLAVRGSLGTLGYATKENEGWNINSQLAILRTNKSEISGMFLIQYLLGSKGQKEIFSRNTGTALKQLPIKQLKDIPVPVPTLLEQQKIGNFFKELDNTIALHQRKLDLLKEQKKGYLQKMFPKNGAKVPELRFAGFADDWEQRKLGEISEKVTLKNKDNTFDETLTNSAEFGIISQNDFFDKEISNRSNLNGYYVVENNNFVYNPRISNFAPVGPIKRNKLGRTGVMSPLYYVFKTRNIDNDFLEKYFDTTYWHIFMKLNGDSGARADRFAIKDSVFKEMPIPFPKIEEQIKIGNFFKQLDDTIALHQRKS